MLFLKQYEPIFLTDFGMVTTESFDGENALWPMSVRALFVPKFTVVNFGELFENAVFPIDVSDGGKDTLTIPVLANALLAIEVNLELAANV